ncbi:MAG TPA: hypothetical protein VFZ08_08535 [Terriglobia bacterium]|nr:hypothetical protein [Terriglobia bacterium]
MGNTRRPPRRLRKNDAAEDLARDVMRYFLRNPQAADNLEGVARWRLADEHIRQTVQGTWEALQLLVAKGYLVERRSALTGKFFALNKENRREAERFVQKAPAPRKGLTHE